MKEKLGKIKEEVEYIQFCTGWSCDTFNGRTCEENTKQAYEEELHSIGNCAEAIISQIDNIILEINNAETTQKD